MLFELSMIPVGLGSHLSADIAEVLKEIEASGLPYKLTPAGTCIEGDWKRVMPVIEKCHYKMRKLAPHVITSIRIEDHVEEEGKVSPLIHNITSVEEKIGHSLAA